VVLGEAYGVPKPRIFTWISKMNFINLRWLSILVSPHNKVFKPIYINAESELIINGVVTSVVRVLK